MRPERPQIAVRAGVFAGFVALGAWHVARLQSPGLGLADLVLPLVLALALALAVTAARGSRVRAAAGAVWLVGLAAVAGGSPPSRSHPLAPFSEAVSGLSESIGRFSTVVLPFDPVAEPGLHRLLLAASALWRAALALVWLVAARPLPTIVLGALPVALASTEFPLARAGVRVALLVALAVWTLASGRRVGPRPIVAFGAPLVLLALVAASLPGLARASLLDWHAWGRGGTSGGAASDVQYAWDQSYTGLHYTGEPVVVLRVRSPHPSYWRVTVLDSFDGLRFEERAPAAAIVRPGARALVEPSPAGARSTVQFENAALDEPYLVGAGNPVAFEVPPSTGGGTVDGNGVLRVLRSPGPGERYSVSAVIADPTRAQLRHPASSASEPSFDSEDATPFAGESPLPLFGDPALPAAVSTALAARPAWRAAYAWGLRATAGAATPYDVALALEKALRAAHPYDGSSTLAASDSDALAHWITSRSPGYCQMFSASMTELLRLLGVRARIAEGFVTGRYDPGSKQYVVDDRDAHAWVEAWLPGAGFVPFDPTPGRSLPTRASSSSDTAAAGQAKRSTATTPGAPAQTPARSAAGSASVATGQRGSSGGWLRTVAAIVALVLLAAAAWIVARSGTWPARARGPRAEAGSSRARLASRARRRGLELPPGVTNGELADALGAGLQLDASSWAHAADAAAYAPGDEAERMLPTLRGETRRLAKAIRASRRVTLPV